MDYGIHHLKFERGRRYVESCLRDGNTLSVAVSSKGVLNRGRVFTYVPEGTDTLYDFRRGIVSDPDKVMEHYVAYLGRHLGEDARNVVVMEQVNASPTTPFLRRLRSRIVTFKEDVYILLTSSDIAQEVIETAIVESSSGWLNNAILTSMPPNSILSRREVLDEPAKLIDKWVQNTKGVVVSAYDLDAYVFFEREVRV